MEFMIINNSPEVEGPAPGTEEFGAVMGRWLAYNQMLIDNGHWISGASLAPSATASTVRKSNGTVSITDGPFIETKEQVGGYYLISADTMEQALELAAAMPVDDGACEVRPVAFRPQD